MVRLRPLNTGLAKGSLPVRSPYQSGCHQISPVRGRGGLVVMFEQLVEVRYIGEPKFIGNLGDGHRTQPEPCFDQLEFIPNDVLLDRFTGLLLEERTQVALGIIERISNFFQPQIIGLGNMMADIRPNALNQGKGGHLRRTQPQRRLPELAINQTKNRFHQRLHDRISKQAAMMDLFCLHNIDQRAKLILLNGIGHDTPHQWRTLAEAPLFDLEPGICASRRQPGHIQFCKGQCTEAGFFIDHEIMIVEGPQEENITGTVRKSIAVYGMITAPLPDKNQLEVIMGMNGKLPLAYV